MQNTEASGGMADLALLVQSLQVQGGKMTSVTAGVPIAV